MLDWKELGTPMRTIEYPRVAGLIVLALAFGLPDAACLAADQDEVIKSRIESVGRLVGSSSAAKRVVASGNAEALAKHREAQSLHESAQAAYREQDLDGARALLTNATQLMFEAARLAETGDARAEKRHKDFDQRMASVDALLKAYERIVEEKGADKQRAGEARAFITAKVEEAQSLERAEKLEPAREALDEAYLSAKIAIEQLRDGDTLVRHLNFASEEEEYDYELDRNDTHRMLVDILLQEKLSKAKGSMEKTVQQFMSKAERLRSKAEEQAAGGEYGAAVNTLELSTKEIVRAIRSAGVYIPG